MNTNHPYYCKCCDNSDNVYSIINSGDYRKSLNKINKVNETFGKINNILLPVLSCYNVEQFKKNIINLYPLILDNSVSGVFLLSTNTTIDVIADVYNWTKSTYPNIWIGINLIGENIFKVFKFIKNVNPDGIWIDNSYMNNISNMGIPELIQDQFEQLNWNGLYFGGIMFKYQSNCNNYDEQILLNTHKYMDVLITSGNGTGIEIEESKLNYIYNNVKNNITIAVASGITEKNIKKIQNKSNIYVVRSSIVNENNDIDIEKLKELINAISS